MSFTLRELAECAERELALRRHVYPGRVHRKRMSPREADRQLGMMAVIAERLRAAAERDEERERLPL